MYNGGKDSRGDWSSYGSQAPQMKIARASQSENVIRKGKGGVEDYTQISYTGRVSKRGKPISQQWKIKFQ